MHDKTLLDEGPLESSQPDTQRTQRVLQKTQLEPSFSLGASVQLKDSIAQAKRDAAQSKALQRNTTVLPEVEFDAGEIQLVPQVRERYDRLKKLGEGGAGEVILLKDNDIYRKVAMKRIKKDVRNNLQMARFIEEVKTIGQLDHPNIIPIHDVGLDADGQHFFTMKYIQGETLAEIIERLQAGDIEYHIKYTFERRAQIFIEILHAVRFAHERGIIHRDIKPENIMVGEYGEVMVMDWGIAKRIRPNPFEQSEGGLTSKTAQALEDFQVNHALQEEPDPGAQRVFETQHGAIIGTPAYMSPEQVLADNEQIDERSDIYSLTLLFYEFLNLVHPFERARSLQELLMAVIDGNIPDSETLRNPHQGPVPRELSFFLRKGLQNDPADRFANIQLMILELQANLEGRTCVYCPSTFLKRGSNMYGHYLDNHRVLGVVLFCIALIFLGLGLWQSVELVLRLVGTS